MPKTNLYVIPTEDIDNYLDYNDNITIFPSVKIKTKTKLNKSNVRSIKLIEELKEQKAIINKLIESKETLSQKYLVQSSYAHSLEDKISVLEKQNMDAFLETLVTLQNNNDFLDDLIKNVIPEHNTMP